MIGGNQYFQLFGFVRDSVWPAQRISRGATVTTRPATPPPSPTAADDASAFIADLRRLKIWSGLSFRQLERRAAAGGETLPASTAATMLSRDRLPRAELLATFAQACGLNRDEILVWLTTRAMIADETKAAAS